MSTEKRDINKIPNEYIPIVYKIPQPKDNILNYKESPVFSKNIDYPKFSLGFQHYIHQSKTKMEITKDFEGKKKVYYVINKFERYVDDYESDVNNISKAYFDVDPKPNILSRAFYKLWELFFMFDLIDLNSDNFVSAHLAEGPGSFIQATMFYRDKFAKKGLSKNDKYYAVTLHAEGMQKHIPKLEESFIDYYKKEKPQRFMLHKTYSKDESRMSPDKDNGDLTNIKTIKLFGGNFNKQKANFITADGGFDWDNENIQEQESFKLILGQVITALKIQDKKGNFVCKVYETFSGIASKLISILASFYDNVYLVKPLMSRASNSEKYVVCVNFKDPKDKDAKISKLENILEKLNESKKNLVDYFPEFNMDEETKAVLIKSNIDIANNQFITINEMITFINKQNYRGEEYTNRRQDQINASKYWLAGFFPDTKEFTSKRTEMISFTNEIIERNNKLVNSLQNKLELKN
ncbi:ribosomal RNA methyltransferase domain [Fadolivirus algeromassiliense]|uniref:Ribosomal RNA methyltransferase domain n=1 Tax=Fadolivirus FV1/VV64 TaxID=3070911 RepID=A0A7D3V8M3_9VIRU|nr:ribosomal RNA methyltransferase domain [Fadolivirus algeromassiliense]QKF93757.1 ribosomal RNA methyltransferase domain [Fadolivirus FV1/VV64]